MAGSDVAVKQILIAKNQEQHFIIEDLDDYHLLIKPEEEERVRRMLDTEVVLFECFDRSTLMDIYSSRRILIAWTLRTS